MAIPVNKDPSDMERLQAKRRTCGGYKGHKKDRNDAATYCLQAISEASKWMGAKVDAVHEHKKKVHSLCDQAIGGVNLCCSKTFSAVKGMMSGFKEGGKPDSERLKQAIISAKLSQKIYSDESSFKHHELKEDLHEHDEVVMVTELLEKGPENHGSYRCGLIINHQTKKITMVIAGTRFDDVKNMVQDLVDDLGLAFNVLPRKFKAIQAMHSMLLDNMGDKIKEYDIHYTGHSLGAVLADLSAAHMAALLDWRGDLRAGAITTATFDNPGSESIVSRFMNEHKKFTDSDFNIHALKAMVGFTSFNNKASFMTVSNQMGDAYRVVHDETKGVLDRIEFFLSTKITRYNILSMAKDMNRHKIGDMISRMEKKLGELVDSRA